MKRKMYAVVLILSLLAGAFSVVGYAEENRAVVSYGLHVLCADTDVALSAPIGNDIVFSAECFARGLNLSHVDSITVDSLPAVSAGELLLGSSRITEGQTVSAQNLSIMVFEAASEDAIHTSFTFRVNRGTTPLVCSLYMTSGINYTPTVSVASGLSLKQFTYKNVALHGKLSGYDPDGDDLSFEVVEYPQKGAVILTDRHDGSYVYQPSYGYVGTDSFSYVARDRYGNYSAKATVQLQIAQPGSALTYADLEDSEYLRAAMHVTEENIMSGALVGDQYCFYPEKEVTRAEFLVMAMNAVGIESVPRCDSTAFFDDADIPVALKGYVAAAHELGYISGSLVNGKLCFSPNDPITRAQAAVMLSNLVGLCEVPVTPTFADQSEIPVWARESVYSLSAAGILNAAQGCISPSDFLLRGEAADLLSNVLRYRD